MPLFLNPELSVFLKTESRRGIIPKASICPERMRAIFLGSVRNFPHGAFFIEKQKKHRALFPGAVLLFYHLFGKNYFTWP